MSVERVLVIKLGALGDVVQATGPFAAIRAYHPDAHITLLTAPAFHDFLGRSDWFDAVWSDERPRWRDLPGWCRLRSRLRGGRFDRAYDLQTSDRSSLARKGAASCFSSASSAIARAAPAGGHGPPGARGPCDARPSPGSGRTRRC